MMVSAAPTTGEPTGRALQIVALGGGEGIVPSTATGIAVATETGTAAVATIAIAGAATNVHDGLAFQLAGWGGHGQHCRNASFFVICIIWIAIRLLLLPARVVIVAVAIIMSHVLSNTICGQRSERPSDRTDRIGPDAQPLLLPGTVAVGAGGGPGIVIVRGRGRGRPGLGIAPGGAARGRRTASISAAAATGSIAVAVHSSLNLCGYLSLTLRLSTTIRNSYLLEFENSGKRGGQSINYT